MNYGTVILFVRAPVKGRVKSRLAASLSEETVLSLYKAFVADIMKTLESVGCPIVVYFDPPSAGSDIREWLGPGCEMRPQKGGDLGERMGNALVETLKTSNKAILIGSDSPDLTGDIIEEALLALEKAPAVIGPSLDGGFYLVGFRSGTAIEGLFDGVEWGTDKVYAQTTERLLSFDIPVHRLPPWPDIDEIDDLRALWQRQGSGSSTCTCPVTVSCIAEHLEEVF